MTFSHIIFDLDGTLYSGEGGLLDEIGKRIELWLQEHLELDAAAASALRQDYLQRYGTTFNGLVAEQPVKVDEYLDFVHDAPIERFLQPDPALGRMLAALPLRRAVYTNGLSEYARRVLRALDVEGYFERVIGIREVGMRSKPDVAAYQRALALLPARPEQCIMVEDRAVNLPPARALGMTTVLLDGPLQDGVDYAIADILDVGPLVAGLLGG